MCRLKQHTSREKIPPPVCETEGGPNDSQEGGERMAKLPRITLEMEGLDELIAATEKARGLLDELRDTLDEISITQTSLQVKINQPTADAKLGI